MWVMYTLKTTILSKCEMDETLKKWVLGVAAADRIVLLYFLASEAETDEPWRCCCGSLSSFLFFRGMCGSEGHVTRCEMLEPGVNSQKRILATSAQKVVLLQHGDRTHGRKRMIANIYLGE